MDQLVRVKEIHEDGTATVVHIRESACSGDCHKCSGCGAAKEAILFKADNPIGARRGDLVNVRSETGPVLKAAVVLYMLPLVLFFAGYAAGEVIGMGALMGGLAFALSIVLIVLYDRHLQKKDNTVYTITDFAGDSILKSMKKGDNDLG